MSSVQIIRSQARVLALRLRLRLTSLATVEAWADEAILEDDAPPELADLCLATRAGERITQRILDDLGGQLRSADVMRALADLDTETATQDDLRRLSDNLDPVLQRLERAGDLPKALAPAVGFARGFWNARMEGSDALRALERDAKSQRDLLETYLSRYRDTLARETPDAVQADARIISRAIPSTRVHFPKKLPIVLIVTLGALIAIIGFLATAELLRGEVYRTAIAPLPEIDEEVPVAPVEPKATPAKPEFAESLRTGPLLAQVRNLGRGIVIVTRAGNEPSSELALDLARELAAKDAAES